MQISYHISQNKTASRSLQPPRHLISEFNNNPKVSLTYLQLTSPIQSS